MTKRFRDLSPVLAAFFFVVAVVEALAWSHWFTADAAEAADAKIKLVKNVWLMEVKDGPVTPDRKSTRLNSSH